MRQNFPILSAILDLSAGAPDPNKPNERQMSKDEAEYLYTFIALGSVGMIRKWLAEGAKKPASEIAELILKISNVGYCGF